MGMEEGAALALALDLREKIYHTGLQLPRPDDDAPATRTFTARTEEADFLEPKLPPPEPASELTTVLRLQRRTASLLLVMADTPLRAQMAERLRGHGYHRLELLEDLDQVGPFCASEARGGLLPQLVVADLNLAHTGDAEPLAGVRIIEHALAAIGNLATVILCETVDPTLLLAQAASTRCLPYEAEDLERWIGSLDSLITAG